MEPTQPELQGVGLPILDAAACPLCGRTGERLYEGLRARVYPAPGTWCYRSCPDTACGLVWLDPMPAPGALPRFYQTYLTHRLAVDPVPANGWVRSLYRRSKRAYLSRRYAHASQPGDALLLPLAYLLPWRLPYLDFQTMYLRARPRGRLLDVGCGSGWTLVAMRDVGWEAEGVDFDERAAGLARSQGLRVRVGTLEAQGFASGSFDAVVLSHVIEHVPDPAALVRECARVLKPGGRIVIVTPNQRSLGHRRFGSWWYYLDPPRHLHLFCRAAMLRMTEPIFGARRCIFSTSRGAGLMSRGSPAIQHGTAWDPDAQPGWWDRFRSEIWEADEWVRIKLGDGDAGEELVLVAQKAV